MALIEFNRDPSQRQVRQFALFWLSGFCFLLAALAVYRDLPWAIAAMLAGCGAVSIALGVARPRWMRIVFLLWMWAAFPIGWAISHLLVAAVYYLVVTPIGLAMWMMGRDPLARRFEPDSDTYWTPRPPQAEVGRYFRQY